MKTWFIAPSYGEIHVAVWYIDIIRGSTIFFLTGMKTRL